MISYMIYCPYCGKITDPTYCHFCGHLPPHPNDVPVDATDPEQHPQCDTYEKAYDREASLDASDHDHWL